MRKIVPENWNTYCDKEGDSDGEEGTVMGRRGQ